jgi:hypothetical protein
MKYVLFFYLFVGGVCAFGIETTSDEETDTTSFLDEETTTHELTTTASPLDHYTVTSTAVANVLMFSSSFHSLLTTSSSLVNTVNISKNLVTVPVTSHGSRMTAYTSSSYNVAVCVVCLSSIYHR